MHEFLFEKEQIRDRVLSRVISGNVRVHSAGQKTSVACIFDLIDIIFPFDRLVGVCNEYLSIM